MTQVIPPQNDWIRKLIPDMFVDVEYLFEEVLFGGLIFFWENDDGEESLRSNSVPWDEEVPKWNPVRKDCYEAMKAAYAWAKSYKDMEPQSVPATGHASGEEFRALLEEYRIKMQEWEDATTLHLMNIVKYRAFLWS